MRIFDDGTWGEKTNFVDKNNILVGYDMMQKCCESLGWFIDDEVHNNLPSEFPETNIEDLEEYVFDPKFFLEVEPLEDSYGLTEFDAGGMVVFKLIADKSKPFYLHLYNCHNGYYSHGFELKHNGKLICRDCL